MLRPELRLCNWGLAYKEAVAIIACPRVPRGCDCDIIHMDTSLQTHVSRALIAHECESHGSCTAAASCAGL